MISIRTMRLLALSLPIFSFGCGSAVEEPVSCAPTSEEYTIYVIPTAGNTMTDLRIMGVPTPAQPGTVNAVSLLELAHGVPPAVSIQYNAPIGNLLFNIPLGPESGGLFFIDTAGPTWIHTKNPVDAPIVHISLITANGEEVLPFGGGISGLLMFPLQPKIDFALVGLLDGDYKKIRFETNTGQSGEIML